MINRIAWLLTLMVPLTLTTRALAQVTTADADRVVTLTYDISDLLMRAPDYPLGEAPFARAPAPQAPRPAETRASLVDQWIALIMDTVASDTWRDRGGQIGSIRAIQNVLVVTQTRANHQELGALLAEFRDGGPMTMISVRAYWIKLEPQEVAAIFAARGQQTNASGSTMPLVPDALLDKSHLYFMGQTTCFNAQTVMITSLRNKTYISDVTPIVSANAVAFDPTIGVAQHGVTLQVMPRLMPGGDAAVLDLHSNVQENTPAPDVKPTISTTRPIFEPQPGLSIQRVDGVSQQLNTTVRVPLNKRVLIGGMTLEAGDETANPRQLYLAVEVNAMR
jgi:hypothetical protein